MQQVMLSSLEGLYKRQSQAIHAKILSTTGMLHNLGTGPRISPADITTRACTT